MRYASHATLDSARYHAARNRRWHLLLVLLNVAATGFALAALVLPS